MKKKKNLPEQDLPRVLGASRIDVISCKVCKSIYQPEHRHVELHPSDMVKLRPDMLGFANCPLCGYKNAVKFEKPPVKVIEPFYEVPVHSYVDLSYHDRVQQAYDIIKDLVCTQRTYSSAVDQEMCIIDAANKAYDILKPICEED